jgi:hypothetical protein
MTMLNNAERMSRGEDPLPGEAAMLYFGIQNILLNEDNQHTRWGFLPWVKTRKIQSFLFKWSCRARMVL